MASGLGLRYPSALDWPAANVDSSPFDQSSPAVRGVSIDRKVFRKVRRSGSRKSSKNDIADFEDAPLPIGRDRDDDYTLEGQDVGTWQWLDRESRQEQGQGNDIDVLDLDRLLGSFPPDTEEEEDIWRCASTRINLRRPCSAPAGGRTSHGKSSVAAAQMQSIASPWKQPPKRPGPPKKDPVSRGAQMRELWSRDRFLRESGRKKFDLRGCGESSPGSISKQSPHIPPQMLLSSYVPPHQKRRHSLRNQIHQQMI